MIRYDGKGFHPTIRPQFPHRKRERTKLKVFRRILPEAWQLSMMKFGIRFVVLVSDRFESVEFGSCESALLEPMCVEIGCNDSGTWYVDTNGCGMLQANQANPPPKKGFARKFLNWVKGFFMNIGKVLSLATLMAIANACHKDPVPNPTPTPTPVPTDTITPIPHDSLVPTPQDTIPQIIPWREVTIPWVWGANEGFAPPSDTIENYTNDPYVKYVFIYILTVQNIGSTWKPESFHRARDTLQTRINIDSTKVIGRGVVKVGKDGAHIHPDTLTKKYGMWEPDSLWFTKHGWQIQRFEKHK